VVCGDAHPYDLKGPPPTMWEKWGKNTLTALVSLYVWRGYRDDRYGKFSARF